MDGEVWDNPEEQRVESLDRGPISSELEVSDSDLEEVEEILGFSVDEAFDRFEEASFETSRYQTRAAANPEGDEMVLKAVRDVSPHVLAHESVHGMMMQPEAENYLPGENQFENRLYDEFVARLAESEIRELSVDEGNLDDLRRSRAEYFDVREQYAGEELTEEFESLYDDLKQTDETTNEQVQREIDGKAFPYQEERERVLAAEAAKRYSEEKEFDLQEFIKPDEKTYREAVWYIGEVEQDVT